MFAGMVSIMLKCLIYYLYFVASTSAISFRSNEPYYMYFRPFQIFRKEPFFYGHDNHDQLVKIARVMLIWLLS